MPGQSKEDKGSKKRCVLIIYILKYYSYEHSNENIDLLEIICWEII